MKCSKVNIMGTEYTIKYCEESEHPLLKEKNRDGCFDASTKEIIICEKKADCELQDYNEWKKVVLRHEIIHAFFFESGLDTSTFQWVGGWAENEEMVDWMAIQFPKILKVYEEVGAL